MGAQERARASVAGAQERARASVVVAQETLNSSLEILNDSVTKPLSDKINDVSDTVSSTLTEQKRYVDFACTEGEHSRGITILNSPLAQKLGDYSYTLYCCHFPAFFFATWFITAGFPFGDGAGKYVLNRCFDGPTNGDGIFGFEYYHLPYALAVALVFAVVVHKLEERSGVRKFIEKKLL